MKVPFTRLGQRLAAASVGAVSLAVVAASTIALAGGGAADASQRTAVHSVARAASPLSSNQLSYTAPLSGTTSTGRQVTGTFRPTVTRVRNGVLQVRGRVRGTIDSVSGSPVKFTRYNVWLPVKTIGGKPLTAAAASRQGLAAPKAAAAASCPVLNLVLGPLDLNLLGLTVHLDKVVLNITAVPGAGNLLGNLLCAVAGLLDNTPLGGLLPQLSTLLTSILGILNA
jgi:hypothetical protein